MVVLDTCALIELCCKDGSLSEKTVQKIDKGAFILSVSFAEIECKCKIKKLEMDIETLSLYNHFQQVPDIRIVDIGVEDWLRAVNLNWDTNNDPVDRLITAFAMQRQLSIITSDKRIKKYYKDCIW
jgi:PIN domain nuclease of toxin-antitoxin system